MLQDHKRQLRYDFISVDTFLEAWAYEANRFFRDRLVGAQSQDQFDSTLRNAMIQFFNADVDVGKVYCISIITLGDDGVPFGRFQENIDGFVRRVPISFQLLQRHEAGRSERDVHALRAPAASDVSDGKKNNLPQLLTSIHKSQLCMEPHQETLSHFCRRARLSTR